MVSIGFMTKDEAPVIWRGPMLHSAIKQFFHDVAWRDLDYLIIDMPPGTGDVALSLAQTVPVAGSIVVTTPQQVSLADSRRAIRMYEKLNIPALGVVENMSYYECPSCHHEANIFGHGGGETMAEQMGVPFLGRLPIYEPIRVGSDVGIPLVIAEPQSGAAQAFTKVASQMAAQISIRRRARRRSSRENTASAGQVSTPSAASGSWRSAESAGYTGVHGGHDALRTRLEVLNPWTANSRRSSEPVHRQGSEHRPRDE